MTCAAVAVIALGELISYSPSKYTADEEDEGSDAQDDKFDGKAFDDERFDVAGLEDNGVDLNDGVLFWRTWLKIRIRSWRSSSR